MRKILFLFIILTTSLLYSQTKDGTTLFSVDLLGKNDLYLNLEGSWKFNLTTFAEGNISSAIENIAFSQLPDLTASLWLFNKFFFETKIVKNMEENIFLLGYQSPETIISEIRVGNDDLNISKYAGYTPPINKNRSPGFRIKLQTEQTTHELLGRVSSEQKRSLEYRGYNIVKKELIPLNNYQRGVYFILPSFNGFDLDLYSFSDDNFKIINSQEYIYDKYDNSLKIENSSFDNIYLEISTDNIDLIKTYLETKEIPIEIYPWKNFDEYFANNTIIKNNITYIKLFEKGEITPYEHLGCYDLEKVLSGDLEKSEIYINGEKTLQYSIKDNLLIFKNSDSTDDKYPFVQTDSEIYSIVGNSIINSKIIEYRNYDKIESFILPKEAKENSINVTLNGLNYNNFDYNSESGDLNLNKAVTPFDEILINYKVDAQPGINNAIFSYGSNFLINDNFGIEGSNTVDWDIPSSDFTTEDNESIGLIDSKTSLSYTNDNTEAVFSNSIKLTNPNTIGKYQLFSYKTNELLIPLTSLIIKEPDDSLFSLVKRSGDYQPVTLDKINEIPIISTDSNYLINCKIQKTNFKTILFETNELKDEETSSLTIKLDEYSGDYSWAGLLHFDIANLLDEQEIKFTFIGAAGKEFEKTILIKQHLDNFKTYSIIFDRADREKLALLDSIKVSVTSGGENLFLIKNISFSGDTLSINKNDINLLKNEDNLLITSDKAGESLEISSRINSIDMNNYSSIEFTLFNTEFLNRESLLKIDLKNFNEIIGSFTIPAKNLVPGLNRVKILLEERQIYLNDQNSIESTFSFNNKRSVSQIELSINSYSPGKLEISEISLNDPKLELTAESSLDVAFSPNINIDIFSIPILNSVKFELFNKINYLDLYSYYGVNSVQFNLLLFSLGTSFTFANSSLGLSYYIKFPNFNSPFLVKDSFEYNKHSYRVSSLEFKTKPLKMEISLSNTGTETVSNRISKADLTLDFNFIKLENKLTLDQEKNGSLNNLENELLTSYLEILPEAELNKKNSIDGNITLSLTIPLLKFTTELNGKIDQTRSSYKNSNLYSLLFSPELQMDNFSITPTISSEYRTGSENIVKNSLLESAEYYINNFTMYNPFIMMNLYDIFISDQRSIFYNYNYSDLLLKSIIKLKIENNYLNDFILNFIIPNKINGEYKKEFSKKSSQEITNTDISVGMDFTKNSLFKNRLNFTNTYNIEKSENSQKITWYSNLLKEFSTNILLDITNDIVFSNAGIKNQFNSQYNWVGKSGPVFIIPLINKAFNSPYNYKHKEKVYINYEELNSKFMFGFKHETTLEIKDSNETSMFIDIGYKTYGENKLNLEAGINIKIIF